ncbi:hypothetical protein [Desulfobacter postgatei]|uniref:hypothetical protein n=1 Tax=Desulfobacter postgatei TaxID=2293 RepID=UPI002A35A4EF|nr:hypothetical protein [Desulfobacter postgatei]MDX9964070.1 hypothetical protein [Desulfobacter postgatei]
MNRISRKPDGITLDFKNDRPQDFDAVVVATHADQALKLLETPSAREKELLGAWSLVFKKQNLPAYGYKRHAPQQKGLGQLELYTSQKIQTGCPGNGKL